MNKGIQRFDEVFNSCRPHQNRVIMQNKCINARFFCINDRIIHSNFAKFTFFRWIGARFGARFSVKSGKKISRPAFFAGRLILFMRRTQQGSFARVGIYQGNVCRRVQPVFPNCRPSIRQQCRDEHIAGRWLKKYA